MILDYLKPQAYLSKEEERELIFRCKNDDLKAKERLILSNIKYVYSQAKRMTKNKDLIDELVVDGVIGMLKAISSFDLSKSNRFITFSSYWIQNEMYDTLYSRNSSVHFSNSKAREAAKLLKIINKRAGFCDSEELIRDLAYEFSCSEKEICQLINLASPHISLDAKISSDSKYNLLDLQENTQLSPEDEYMRKAEIESLLNAINQLSAAEKDVLIRHYGLYNQPVQTFEEIAEVQKKSKARIHQIEKTAKAKLILKLA